MGMHLEEYNQAVKRWATHVLRFVNSSLQNMDASKDIVQDSFVVLWEKRNAVEADKVKQFLFTVAFRKMLNYKKTLRPESDIEDGADITDYPNQESFEHKQEVKEYIRNLSPVQQQVLQLRDIEGYSYQEIQEITGLSESQVKVYLFRARVSMKEQIIKEQYKVSFN